MRHGQPVLLCLAFMGVSIVACDDSGDAAAPDNTPPEATFESACTGLACTFTESSSDADGSIAAWSWDFGDGTSSADQNAAHTYAAAGTYQVALTVTDNEGETDSETKGVTVSAEITTPINLTLTQSAGFKATLTGSVTCEAHGNLFRVVAPVADTLTTDGCFDAIGTEIVHAGPFAAGTVIQAEIISPHLSGPPLVQVDGSFPVWTIRFEDGPDADYDDITVTITALP